VGCNLRTALVGLAVVLSGCGGTMHDAALNTFAKSHPGCRGTVQERADLIPHWPPGRSFAGKPIPRAAIEVTGCQGDIIYECLPRHWEDTSPCEDGRRCVTPRGPICEDSGWCTPDGCDSFELAARNAFMKDKSCPLERVDATRATLQSAPPPPEISADPERLRIWTKTNQEKLAAHTLMSATGCGSTSIYDCAKASSLTRAIPVCSLATQGNEAAR
jgi:hypothetical protein